MNLRARGVEVNYRSLVQSMKKSGADFRGRLAMKKICRDIRFGHAEREFFF